jgi:acetyl-CoA carboxylase biotin carboxylase subunit
VVRPISKVLIANRGEIALRVVWACKELGLRTVAVYSEADADSLHVKFADEEVCIGPPPSRASYLNFSAILSAAEITQADAIHPGYGFLAENAEFADACQQCGITFVGPSPEAIRLMGDKAEARRRLKRAGVPVLPGSEGVLDSEAALKKAARAIGYPVILKAAYGGGGRGMRIVHSPQELLAAFAGARAEAGAAFGAPDIYLEKYLATARHIEVQLLADQHGSCIHLGERECSIQRRHQKLIEESPSTALDPELRQRIAEAALQVAREVHYSNAGTVEFLLDPEGRFYFMEMNTRIQVEHPVTEMRTNVDLVKAQLRIAAGEPLWLGQADIVPRGHAIECRINAEDPLTLRPNPGQISAFNIPKGMGVRVDTAAHEAASVPPYYDSLVAKVIVLGQDRAEAIARMRRCLEGMVVEGISTTIPLHLRVLADPEFLEGRLSTRFLDRYFAPETPGAAPKLLAETATAAG